MYHLQHFHKIHHFRLFASRRRGAQSYRWPLQIRRARSTVDGRSTIIREAAASRRKEFNMEVVVTSRDIIKPSCPTPQHLRNLLPFSFFDQLMNPCFEPIILFYSKAPGEGADMINKYSTNLKTSNILKASLADTLVKFYPLAGRVKENHMYTECNDQGVPYFEAQANCNISQVVGESCLPKLNKLLPYGQQPGDLAMAIQVNFFDCGGIAIGVCFNHKVVDGTSMCSFLNYWAGIARVDHRMNLIGPRFGLAKLFPPLEKQIFKGTITCSGDARRFLFSASALSALRSKYAMPTSRAEALSAFLWTRILAARKGKDIASAKGPLLAHHCVNVRTRIDPPLSPYHIGNLVVCARVGSSMDVAMTDDSVFVAKSKVAIRGVDDKFVKNLQDVDFAYRYVQDNIAIAERLRSSNLLFTSVFKFPWYEADFGWGRPLWVTMSGQSDPNTFVFMPTRSGDGVEVLAYLDEDDMAKLEGDKVLLKYVSPTSIG